MTANESDARGGEEVTSPTKLLPQLARDCAAEIGGLLAKGSDIPKENWEIILDALKKAQALHLKFAQNHMRECMAASYQLTRDLQTELADAVKQRDEFPVAGDYVLATKYEDGDTHDHFCVGYVTGMTHHNRFNIVNASGHMYRGNGFRCAVKITKEEGGWLVSNMNDINESDPSVWQWLNIAREALADSVDAGNKENKS